MSGPHLYARPGTAVLWCHFTVAGKLVRRSTGERDRAAAFEAATKAWLEACHRARVPLPEGQALHLQRLVALYLADLRHRLERRELVRGPTYADDQEKALKRLPERWQAVGEVGPGWALALAEWHADGAGWRTLQLVTVAARALLRWAKAQGHLPAVPEIQAPPSEDVVTEAKERRPLTERERDALLRVLRKEDPRAWRVYTVLFYSAARKSDLERLTWRQVDFKGGWLHFPPRQTKSKKRGQVVGLHPKAEQALRAELRQRKVVDPADLVFGEIDYRMTQFSRWLDAAGVKDRAGLTAHHVTRHTTATLTGDSGASLAELMALGRWSTPAMALRYMKVSARASKTALGRL